MMTSTRKVSPSLILFAAMVLLAWWFKAPTGEDAARASEGYYEATCIHTIDGDTVDVRLENGERWRVRLLGIDCMETHNLRKMEDQARWLGLSTKEVAALGTRASRYTKDRLSGKEVTLVIPEGTPVRDPYERVLAYIEVGGEDVGEGLLREGLAETRRESHPRSARYRRVASPLTR